MLPKPKSKYPLDAYSWENLFIACHYCQEKGDKFNSKLLRSDAPEYDFYTYFIYNAATGEIEPNPSADWDLQERAIETILLYKLNEHDLPQSRKRMQKVWSTALKNNLGLTIDDCPYRFMFL